MSTTRKRVASTAATREALQQLSIRPLGAGNEVGRSCILLKFAGKTIMLDCGILPSFRGEESLPFLREINDPSEIDIIIISHFHLDHSAALPHFTERMQGFKGRIFATHPTVAVMKMILSDMIRLTSQSAEPQLYDERDLHNCLQKIECVDFLQRISVEGITFQFFNAGHVLGAAMVLIEIAGVQLLYTGDYSAEEDRHLMAAKPPPGCHPDVLICESTFGMRTHPSRESREQEFLNTIDSVVMRGGRCLVPVFALGRAQELLLILEEYWRKNEQRLRNIPVYYASEMAAKSLELYKTFVSFMNARVQAHMGERNPWEFDFIRGLKSQTFRDSGPCVVLASPGMLQHGMSRMLFDRWAEDPKNGIVLAGYSVEGTLAHQLLTEPPEVEALDGRIIQRRAQIKSVSFAAHADSIQTSQFIEALQPRTIVLVHGERREMERLYVSLANKYKTKEGFQVFMPSNTKFVNVRYKDERLVKAVGKLANAPFHKLSKVSGVLVKEEFSYSLYAPEDLPEHTPVAQYSIAQRQHIPFRSSMRVLTRCLRAMYDDVEEIQPSAYVQSAYSIAHTNKKNKNVSNQFETVQVSHLVNVTHLPPDRILLEWNADPVTDMIAESVIAVAAQAEVSPFNLEISSSPCGCQHNHDNRNDAKPDLDLEEKDAKTGSDGKEKIRSDQVVESDTKMESDGKMESDTKTGSDENDVHVTLSKRDMSTKPSNTKASQQTLRENVLLRILRSAYGRDSVTIRPDGTEIRVDCGNSTVYIHRSTFEVENSTDLQKEKENTPSDTSNQMSAKALRERVHELVNHVLDATGPIDA